jgi:predicted Zn finger-like uncharacterized protein
MILECEKCHARFLVADSMMPSEGRTVRCGACSHQWFAPGPEATPFAAELPLAETHDATSSLDGDEEDGFTRSSRTRNVPAIKKRPISARPFKIAVPVLALVWFGIAFVTYFPRWMALPGLASVYEAMGITPNTGLVFDDVHMDHEQNEDRTKYIISGSIVNHASVPRVVPTVYVALKNKDGKALWGREYPVNAMLKAGEVYPFRIDNIETSFAGQVSSIVVDLGNSLQLLMR